MTDIVTRLRNPPFGTETSERNLMTAAADEIERLRAALEKIAKMDFPRSEFILQGPAILMKTARAALQPKE